MIKQARVFLRICCPNILVLLLYGISSRSLRGGSDTWGLSLLTTLCNNAGSDITGTSMGSLDKLCQTDVMLHSREQRQKT